MSHRIQGSEHCGRGRRLWTPVLVVTIVASAGCSDLLNVDVPSRTPASALEDPSRAALLIDGVVADFECAFARYILNAGLLGHELADAQLQGTWWNVDRRTLLDSDPYGVATCETTLPMGVYRPLSVARFQADDALSKLGGWSDAEVPQRTELIATAAAYGGYSLVLMGEGMCSSALDVGPELTGQELFALAEDRFNRAIAAAQASGRPDLLNLSHLGRARALLNQGKNQEAAADARLIPAGFRFDATYSAADPRRYNQIFEHNVNTLRLTVAEPFRNVEFEGVPDPRVAVTDRNQFGIDNVTRAFTDGKYGSRSAPIPIARWEEAQLIIAEVAGGQEAVDIINTLHAAVGLPPFASSDPEEIRQQVFEERARELFLESHHLGDLNRLGLPLVPAAGTPYPPKAGGSYGSDRCFPLPISEWQNNPNINR
jgi:starch-binding outer membrane protein, SusD/RagB family